MRIDIEQDSGRTVVSVHPDRVTICPGDGIEWDFRYLLGADVIVERVEVRFSRKSPFSKSGFKSKKPDGGRPHRQLSGPARASAEGREFRCTIHCFNLLKAEVAKAEARVAVSSEVVE